MGERGDLYNEVHQHDMTQTPWPFENDKYDLSVCNGVLIYVKDNGECLDEFIRVTKSGGYCLLMLRGDALSEFSSKIYQLITDKNGKLQKLQILAIILKQRLRKVCANIMCLIIITFFKYCK